MEPSKEMVERRRSKRYIPEEGTLVAVFDTIAQVVDISQTGLSFICIDWEDLTYDEHKLDILYEESEWLKDIPFTVVSRKILEDRHATQKLHFQRCGISFKDLNAEQKRKLDFLLLNYTRGAA